MHRSRRQGPNSKLPIRVDRRRHLPPLAARLVALRARLDAVVVLQVDVAVAVDFGETVVIDFRLVVVMRRVTGPAAGVVDDFAEHEIRLRPGGAVEDQTHVAQAGVLDESGAAVFG